MVAYQNPCWPPGSLSLYSQLLLINFKADDSLLEFLPAQVPQLLILLTTQPLFYSLSCRPLAFLLSRVISLSLLCSPDVLPSLTDSDGQLTLLLFPSALDSCIYLWIYSLFHSQQPHSLNHSTEQPFRWFLHDTSSHTHMTIFQYVLQSPPPKFSELFKIALVTGSQIFNMESVMDNSHSNHSKTKLTIL